MESKFDLRTHVRHPKSGRVIEENHYRLRVEQNKEGSGPEALYERPVGSGIWYYADNQVCLAKSQEGLAKRAQAEADKHKTELQKAREAHLAAEKAYKSAQEKYDAEEKAKQYSAKNKGA